MYKTESAPLPALRRQTRIRLQTKKKASFVAPCCSSPGAPNLTRLAGRTARLPLLGLAAKGNKPRPQGKAESSLPSSALDVRKFVGPVRGRPLAAVGAGGVSLFSGSVPT